MSETKGFLSVAVAVAAVAAMVFIISCSPDDGGGGGSSSSVGDGGSSSSEGTQGGVSSSSDDGEGNLQSYNYCIYIEAQVCFAGPYKECPGGGIPSNSCPYSNVVPSSSSSEQGISSGETASSSSEAESSSSVPPSSSSVVPSSSSVLSSSSLAPSSSSLEPSSSSLEPSSSSSVTFYAYCIKDGACLEGPFTLSECVDVIEGSPSNSCPSPSSSSVVSSSSSIENNTSLLWDLSMGFAVQTGGVWFNYYDQVDVGGTSFSLFYENTNGYINHNGYYKNANGYPNISGNDLDWNGEVRFSLDPSGYSYAYAGVGFLWPAPEAPAIWSNHTGLCVEYFLSGGGDYYLKISTDGYTENNEYKIALPKQNSMGKKLFAFSSFAQESDWGYITTLSEAKNKSVGMNIEGRAFADNYTRVQEGTLVIKSIYWDSCN